MQARMGLVGGSVHHQREYRLGLVRFSARVDPSNLYQPAHNARLELRPARHSTSMLKLSDGSNLEEPPCIEGYLYRLGRKQGKASREQVYVYSFDG